jgi:hypothetical protein
VILKLTPDPHVANSILEKSFVKIWGNIDSYDVSEGRIFTLLIQITLQQCEKDVGLPKNLLNILIPKLNSNIVELNNSYPRIETYEKVKVKKIHEILMSRHDDWTIV